MTPTHREPNLDEYYDELYEWARENDDEDVLAILDAYRSGANGEGSK